MNGSSKYRFDKFSEKLKNLGTESYTSTNNNFNSTNSKFTKYRNIKNLNNIPLSTNSTNIPQTISTKENKDFSFNHNNNIHLTNTSGTNKLHKLETKLYEVEENFNSKFLNIDLKYNNLQEELSKYIKNYEETRINDNNYKDVYGQLEERIEHRVINYDQELSSFIEQIYSDLDKKLKIQEEGVKAEYLNFKNKVISIKQNLEEDLPTINSYLSQESEKREKFFNALFEEIKSELTKIEECAFDFSSKTEESKTTYQVTLLDIQSRVKDQLEKERKHRDNFEENIFSILEDTCNKLIN